MADDIRIEVDVEVAKARKQIDKLNTEIDKETKKVRELKDAFADAHAPVTNMFGDLGKLTNDLAKAKAQLAEIKRVKEGFAEAKFGAYTPNIDKLASASTARAYSPNITKQLLKNFKKISVSPEDFEIYKQLRVDYGKASMAVTDLQNKIAKTKEEMASSKDPMNAIISTETERRIIEQIVKTQSRIESLNNQVDEVKEKYKEAFKAKEQFEKQDIDRKNYLQNLVDTAKIADPEIYQVNQRLKDLIQTQKDYEEAFGEKPVGIEQYDETVKEIARLKKVLKDYAKARQEAETNTPTQQPTAPKAPKDETWYEYVAGGPTEATTFVDALKQRLETMKEDAKNLGKMIVSGAKNLAVGIGKFALNTAKTTGIAIFSATKRIALSIGDLLKAALTNAFNVVPNLLKGISKPLKDLKKKFSSFGKRLKTAILQGLIFRPVRTGLTKVVQMYGELIKANTEVSKSFAQVKGSAIIAFQPFLTAIVPIIKTVCDWIVKLIQYLSALMGIFFGIGKASKTAAKNMYAQSKAAGASGKANDKFLASWDTLQKVTSSSGGGGGSDTATPDFDIDDGGIEDKLAWLKEKLELNDWYGIGMEIERRLNDVRKTIDNWINSVFAPNVAKWSKNIADLLNGLTDGLDPQVTGRMIADFLNACINGAFVFLSTFNFDHLGAKLAQIINNIISTVNWKQLGQTVTKGILDIYDMVINFVDTLDWGQIGVAIGKFISEIDIGDIIFKAVKLAVDSLIGLTDLFISAMNNIDWNKVRKSLSDGFYRIATEIDWAKLATNIFTALGQAFGLVVGVLWKLLQLAWQKIINWWRSLAEEDGEYTADGVLAGIGAVFKNIYSWIKTNVVDPFIRAFKNLFGIASPSKVMAEQGAFISAGMLKGISDGLANIGAWIKNNIFTPIVGGINKLFGIKGGVASETETAGSAISKGLTNGISNGLGAIKSVLNSIISAVETAVNWIINKLNTLSWEVPSWVPLIGGKTWGFNVPNIALPRLAQGAVVNPGHEFTAVLGDNRHEQEVVSPLSTMKQAFIEAMAESGNANGARNITLQIDGQTFARITNPYLQKETSRVGIKAVGGIA